MTALEDPLSTLPAEGLAELTEIVEDETEKANRSTGTKWGKRFAKAKTEHIVDVLYAISLTFVVTFIGTASVFKAITGN